MKLRELKTKAPDNWFTLKPIEYPKDTQVYVKDFYDKSVKKYWCYKFSDVNSGRYISGDKEVFTDFIF